MNADELWDNVTDDQNLELAFNYALNDRYYESYYDPIEIYKVQSEKDEILQEVKQDLADPENYSPQSAYSYFPPKNNLCFRRMVYIPFKDLVIRYAIIKVLADQVDIDLHNQCFANRREKGEDRDKRLLENFAEKGWPDFCLWQADCLDKGYNVLLRTDISAFYDSISHDNLLESICKALSINSDAKIIQMLREHLKIDVVSYSYVNNKPKDARTTQQGITIGNSCDAFLGNVYLNELDNKLSEIEGIKYGRYNDDIRIFAEEREEVLRALQIIQEYLLERGLNLNSTKTELAIGTEEIHQLQSKLMIVSGEETTGAEMEKKLATDDGDLLEDLLDASFEELERVFESGEELKSEKDAKAFCKFLGHRDENNNYRVSLDGRSREHVDKLTESMKSWRSATKHAAWLIIETAFYRGIKDDVQNYAKSQIIVCLGDSKVSRYGKYRLLHHLTKKRSGKNGEFRFIDDLADDQKEEIEALLEDLIGEPAFDLNIISLFTLGVLGYNYDEIYSFVDAYMKKPIGDPVKSALNVLRNEVEPADLVELEPASEPDAMPGRFSA